MLNNLHPIAARFSILEELKEVRMQRAIRTTDGVRLDLLQAVKRAFMHRGIMLDSQQSSRSPAQSEQTPAAKEVDSQDVHEKLIDITEKAQDVLFQADTVFPFTLFPDTITLDCEKLTVATRSFFRTARIVSVPVSSISSAEVDVGPFFGSLHMASKYFVQNTYSVNFLSRSNAAKIHHLLQGFIIANEKKIDVTNINKDDLLVLLDDLGQGVPD
ncbi:hypothetical protein KW803_02955 [Candidatus Saccharibacteria bacterium]|nr:hypothetical protein [Candidatus Saccharibacteria bacterium]